MRRYFQSTKTYGHNLGLSAAFRQWKAQSHCRFIHGYAMQVKLTFGTFELDCRNWCVDFGGLKSLEQLLRNTFDHKLLVAEDDPWLDILLGLGQPNFGGLSGVSSSRMPCADVIVVPATGCEKFAEMIFEVAEQWLKDAGFSPRCHLVSVEVSEHGGNSAIAFGEEVSF